MSRKKFSNHFKTMALKRWEQSGKSAAEVARKLGINPRCLYAWKKPAARRRGTAMLTDGVARMTLTECAKLIGMHPSTVGRMEQEALRKIRAHPELTELWCSLKEEGFPLAEMPPIDPGEKLLDYQLRVAEWWQTHDRMSELGCGEEASECLAEIRRFQRAITRQLNSGAGG